MSVEIVFVRSKRYGSDERVNRRLRFGDRAGGGNDRRSIDVRTVPSGDGEDKSCAGEVGNGVLAFQSPPEKGSSCLAWEEIQELLIFFRILDLLLEQTVGEFCRSAARTRKECDVG